MKPELGHSVPAAFAVIAGRIGRSLRTALIVAALVAGWSALSGARAEAQELYTFTVGVLGGFGGSPDTDSSSFDRQTVQLNLLFETDARTQVGIRIGQSELTDTGERLNGLFEPKLQYVTVGGEYRTRQSYYDSGVFVALGGYRLEGSGGSSKTAAGISVGATGEFTFNRHFGVVGEIAGHYADLDDLQYFASAQVGLAVHF